MTENRYTMYPNGHSFHLEPNECMYLDVRFVFPIDPYETEIIADVLKKVELFLGSKGGIIFVRSDQSVRCFYCGTKSNDEDKTCSQCGAPL